MLRAVSWQPDGAFDQPGVYLKLRAVIRRMEAELDKGPLATEFRDEVVQILWDLAIELEDGTLANALERMREAQKRLAEAIRNGATPEEIQKLMDELRAATDQYIQMLAEQVPDGTDTPNQGQQGQMMSGNQLDEMMKQMQKLMEAGPHRRGAGAAGTAAAAAGEHAGDQGAGPGRAGGPGDAGARRHPAQAAGAVRRHLRRSERPGRRRRAAARGPAAGPAGRAAARAASRATRETDPQTGDGRSPAQRLADRQDALRRLLGEQQGQMPGAGTPEGDASRDALGRAGSAMDRAERALRDGDLSGALDDQARAMEALREGMRQLGDMMARNQQPGQGQNDQQAGQANGPGGTRRDPLGRDPNGEGALRSRRCAVAGQGRLSPRPRAARGIAPARRRADPAAGRARLSQAAAGTVLIRPRLRPAPCEGRGGPNFRRKFAAIFRPKNRCLRSAVGSNLHRLGRGGATGAQPCSFSIQPRTVASSQAAHFVGPGDIGLERRGGGGDRLGQLVGEGIDRDAERRRGTAPA